MEKRYLTKDEILAINDLPVEDVFIPEWNAYVRVRGLTGAQRDAYEASIVKNVGGKPVMNTENMRAKLVALCVVDEEGKPLFTQADVEKLGQKSGAALQRIFEVAQRLSGLGAEAVEEAAKN